MTGCCRRLLAVFTLVCFSVAVADPALLHAQEPPAVAPQLAPGVISNSVSNWAPLRYHPPISPVWIPPPNLARSPPLAPGANIFKQRIFGQLVFRQLAGAAGIIFSGRVTSIGGSASFFEPAGFGPARASTAITFYVEHAMRGTRAGQSLTIHEWAGLWTSGERYRVGEHVLLFLYPPGKLGLTSPVAGAIGRFPMNSQGGIVMTEIHAAMLAGDPLLGGKDIVSYADFALAVERFGKRVSQKE